MLKESRTQGLGWGVWMGLMGSTYEGDCKEIRYNFRIYANQGLAYILRTVGENRFY
jgi:hypothetical protein